MFDDLIGIHLRNKKNPELVSGTLAQYGRINSLKQYTHC